MASQIKYEIKSITGKTGNILKHLKFKYNLEHCKISESNILTGSNTCLKQITLFSLFATKWDITNPHRKITLYNK